MAGEITFLDNILKYKEDYIAWMYIKVDVKRQTHQKGKRWINCDSLKVILSEEELMLFKDHCRAQGVKWTVSPFYAKP